MEDHGARYVQDFWYNWPLFSCSLGTSLHPVECLQTQFSVEKGMKCKKNQQKNQTTETIC